VGLLGPSNRGLRAGGQRRLVVVVGALLSAVVALAACAAEAGAHGSRARAALQFAAASSSHGANHFLLRRAGDELQLLDLDTRKVLRERPFATTTAVSIDGANGPVDNTLTLDFSRGSLAVAGGISFDGGRGGYNTLDLRGGHISHQSELAYGRHSGLITLDRTAIRYAHIAPIDDTVPSSSLIFTDKGESPVINVVDGPEVAGAQTTQINSGTSTPGFESINFAHKEKAAINGLGGNVAFTLNNPHPALGMAGMTLQSSSAGESTFDVLTATVPLTVLGEGNDALDVGAGSMQSILSPVAISDPHRHIAVTLDDSTDAIARAVTVTPSSVTGLASQPITYASASLLRIDGGAPRDAFTVTPSPTTTDILTGGGSTPNPSPGNSLTMELAEAGSPALNGTPTSQGAQGVWTFANRSPVEFSRMDTLNPTALSIGDASASVGASGGVPLAFTASLLAPSSQTVSANFATADGSATAASGAYLPASGPVVFASGTVSQTISVDALGSPTVRPPQTFLVSLGSPVGALLMRPIGTGTIIDTYQAPGTAATTSPPVLGYLNQSHGVWREGNALAHFSVKARTAPLGTTFAFGLNEPARVSLTFAQALTGRRVGGRCLGQTRGNRHQPACRRTVTRGTLVAAAKSGANKVAFQGRISRASKLAPGSYTLLATATNAAGQVSVPRRLSFKVVR